VSDPANSEPELGDPAPDGVTDEERLRAYADALAEGVSAALGPWVEASVARIAEAWRPGSAADLAGEAAAAAERARATVGPRVRTLLELDVDEQATGPLAIVREAVTYPTEVLQAAGVSPVARDDFAERAFPADVYDLAPASFADLSPDLHEPGLMWGAAKAHVVMSRRRAEGKR
jgi:hypothetical protein